MPIRYFHNDPASAPLLETFPAPTAPRGGPRARFEVELPGEAVHDVGSAEFVDWQCHEAAARTLAAWERVSAPLRFWHGRRRSIRLLPRRQTGIGASYERDRIGFDHHPFGNPTFFAGASADAVAHEIGHAILDAIRPELWDSIFAEVAAFHEGFADCVSLLLALDDAAVRQLLIDASADPARALAVENAASQVAESVADYYREVHRTSGGAAVRRRLRNDFKWELPVTLNPVSARGELASEPHSFGQVFAGCFYDLIDNVYRNGGQHTSDGLAGAAQIAGTLLALAIESAPQEARFFRAVGRAMIHADERLSGGAFHLPIRDAFNAHGLQLGSSAMLAPSASLAGPAPARTGPAARRLNRRTRADLVRRAGSGAEARVTTAPARIGRKRLVRATIEQALGVEFHPAGRATGTVSAKLSQDVLLDGQRGHCVLLGEMPNPVAAADEANSFVRGLDGCGQIGESAKDPGATHRIVKRGREWVLKRICFACYR